MTCEEARLHIQLYVDHELPAPATLAIEAHLMDCPGCRAEYEAVRTVVDAVRGTGPLYQAPKESISKVEALVASHHRASRVRKVLSGVAALLVLALALAVLFRPRSAAAQFEAFATDLHLRYARGVFPLDIVSQQPQMVNGWLSTRLPFHLILPDYPSRNAAKLYSLAGARLVQFHQQDVAFLVYRMKDRPISLLVASAPRVTPSGGEVYRSGNLVFHISAERGLSRITWTDRGLTYALVSDLVAGGAASCVVCHGSDADQEKIRLKSVQTGPL